MFRLDSRSRVRQILIIFWLVTVCFATLFVSGCRQGTGVIVVPINANIPYMSIEHILIDNTPQAIEPNALPESATRILNYLSSPDDFALDTLNILLSGSVSVRPLDDDRLIILDFRNDQLVEYNRRSESSITIATRGEGPGELRFAKDLVVDSSTVYVPRGDRRISVFDCGKTPCTFMRSFSVGAAATSLALVGDDSLAILGSTPVPQDTGVQVSTESQTAVRVMDLDGGPGHDFGAVYDTDGHWMLIQPFIERGDISYLESGVGYAISFDRFPFLYVYDRAGELEKMFRFDEFVVGLQNYWTDTGMLEVVFGEFSVLSTMSLHGSDYVLAEITTRYNRRRDEPVVRKDISRDYYAINLSTDDSYYLGRMEGERPGRLIAIPKGLLVEKDGLLFWVDV